MFLLNNILEDNISHGLCLGLVALNKVMVIGSSRIQLLEVGHLADIASDVT